MTILERVAITLMIVSGAIITGLSVYIDLFVSKPEQSFIRFIGLAIDTFILN